MTKDNSLIGKFILNDIPPAPRGVPQFEITIDIDASHLLNVFAVDKGTGKGNGITITNAINGLSENELVQMIQKE